MASLKFTELFHTQLNSLDDYLYLTFGSRTSDRIVDGIIDSIHVLLTFPRCGKHYMFYKNFDVRQLTSRHNYVFYIETEENIYILAIFDTRMSPKAIQKTVKQELKNYDNTTLIPKSA